MEGKALHLASGGPCLQVLSLKLHVSFTGVPMLTYLVKINIIKSMCKVIIMPLHFLHCHFSFDKFYKLCYRVVKSLINPL
jgi:hypothetical protein